MIISTVKGKSMGPSWTIHLGSGFIHRWRTPV